MEIEISHEEVVAELGNILTQLAYDLAVARVRGNKLGQAFMMLEQGQTITTGPASGETGENIGGDTTGDAHYHGDEEG